MEKLSQAGAPLLHVRQTKVPGTPKSTNDCYAVTRTYYAQDKMTNNHSHEIEKKKTAPDGMLPTTASNLATGLIERTRLRYPMTSPKHLILKDLSEIRYSTWHYSITFTLPSLPRHPHFRPTSPLLTGSALPVRSSNGCCHSSVSTCNKRYRFDYHAIRTSAK